MTADYNPGHDQRPKQQQRHHKRPAEIVGVHAADAQRQWCTQADVHGLRWSGWNTQGLSRKTLQHLEYDLGPDLGLLVETKGQEQELARKIEKEMGPNRLLAGEPLRDDKSDDEAGVAIRLSERMSKKWLTYSLSYGLRTHQSPFRSRSTTIKLRMYIVVSLGTMPVTTTIIIDL